MLLFPFGNAHSQGRVYLNVDSLVTTQAKELITNKKVKQVLIYQSGCIGCEILREKNCGCYDDGAAYMMWKEGSEYFKKKVVCCVKDEVHRFDNSNLYESIFKDSIAVFSSKFKTDYEEIHHGFSKITLVTADNKQEVYMEDFLFAQDNKYRQSNLKQTAKIYSGKLQEELFDK
jgi:hypothetical protein